MTQFITPSEDEEEQSGESHRVETALLDLYRQPGFLQPIKDTKRKPKEASLATSIMGIWIVNFKRTVYGYTAPFPVFVTTDFIRGEVWVECDYLLKRRMRYWEACMAFQQVAGNFEIRTLQKKDACTAIRRKMIELYHTQQDPLLILIQSDGTTRGIWKMISDSGLAKAPRLSEYSLDHLWFESAEANDGFQLAVRDHGLRMIRIRGNDEVPDYLSELKEEGGAKGLSGTFKWGQVYWSIAMRLAHKLRDTAHQYKATLRLPLPLHLGKQLEEYIG